PRADARHALHLGRDCARRRYGAGVRRRRARTTRGARRREWRRVAARRAALAVVQRPRALLAQEARAGRNRLVTQDEVERVRTLLDGPSPSVLTTYRQDASAHVSPVWFRWHDGAFEIVIAKGDVKLAHLERDPRCVLVVFETARPFRGIEAR